MIIQGRTYVTESFHKHQSPISQDELRASHERGYILRADIVAVVTLEGLTPK